MFGADASRVSSSSPGDKDSLFSFFRGIERTGKKVVVMPISIGADGHILDFALDR